MSITLRRFFPIDVPQPLPEALLDRIDPDGFARSIAAIEHVFQRPFATKGMLLQYNLDILHNAFDDVLFIHTRRSLEHNVESLLRSRQNFFGDRAHWYSARPPEFEVLKDLEPVAQVVGQIQCTNRSIEQQLRQYPDSDWIDVAYEDFCENPEDMYKRLVKRMLDKSVALCDEYSGPAKFDIQNRPISSSLSASIQAVAGLPA